MNRRDCIGRLAWLGAACATNAGAAPPPAEHQLIVLLIQRVESMDAMVFTRNGSPHTAAEAGKHMRAKYAHFKDQIGTADDFITRCASRSEMTGKPYFVRIGDGPAEEASTFLARELRQLRRTR